MNLSSIREQMKVVGSDRQLVGTVDHVDIDGERLKLRRSDPQAGGKHHYIPGDWIEGVEGDEVRLRQSAKEATTQWKTD